VVPAVAGETWVWLGGTLLLLVSEHVPVCVAGGLGTLLGPEETPVVGVVLWSALDSAVLTRAWCSWWRCVGLGVVVC
jgi:hypothetical protein